MSHAECYRFSQYADFQKRVSAALSKAATNITSESDQTANYAARQSFVGKVHALRYNLAGASLAVAELLDTTIAGKSDADANAAITDAALDSALGGLFDTLSR